MANSNVEKRPLTFVLFLLRLLSGLTGGVAGTLALFVVYFILSTLIPKGDGSTISVFIIVIMAFVGTLIANSVTALMVTFLDNEKYSRRKTTVTQVFLFNLILFFLTIPLYFLGMTLGVSQGVAAFHLLLSAYVSALIMEVVAGSEYSLLGIYSTSLGIFVSIGIAFVLMVLKVQMTTFTFLAMPLVWFTLQVVGGFTELIYDNFLRYYGVDALNVKTDLGGDKEVESQGDTDDDSGDQNPA